MPVFKIILIGIMIITLVCLIIALMFVKFNSVSVMVYLFNKTLLVFSLIEFVCIVLLFIC